MEIKNLLFLIAGLIIGILGTAVYCEYARDGEYSFEEDAPVVSISEREAVNLRENYSETYSDDRIEGYNISVQQFSGILSTLETMSGTDILRLSGFRLYKGLDTGGDRQSAKSFIIYPIGDDLRMRVPDKVFKVTGFEDKYVLPCPEFCD